MIQPKRKAVLQKGEFMVYNPENFKSFGKIVEDPQEIIDELQPYLGKYITFDTETHNCGLESHDMPAHVVRRWVGKGKKAAPQDFPFCISICDGTQCWSIFDTIRNNFKKFKALATIFEDENIEKIAHNVKFDLHEMFNIRMKIKGKLHDTVTIAKLVDENRKSFKLMDLVQKYDGGIVEYEYMVDHYKKAYKIVDYRDIPKPLIGAYANADVHNAMVLFKAEYPKIAEFELQKLYDTECMASLALWAMERHGMRADLDYETPLKDELQSKCDEAEKAIYEEAGELFNINSSKQLYEVLMRMGTDPMLIKKTDKGNPCLDKHALADLADNHGVSIVAKILEFRKYEKLLGTYANGIYAQRDSAGKVHCSINQTEATTGRMSITKPALQTLHKKDKHIRKIFIPSSNYRLAFLDLDQVEYKQFAHYAQASGLIEMIKKGHDVHQATAALIYSVPYEEVTEDQRGKAKTINFSLLYGAGEVKTASSLDMSVSEARKFKDNYFNQIPEALPFIAQVQRVTKTRGYIKNMYGRRRRLTYNECYKAPNALIQGCAADYFKSKIVAIYAFLKSNGYRTRMLVPVHDELVFEVHHAEMYVIPKLRWLFSDYDNYRVPITAGVEMGDPSWGQKIDVDVVEPLRPCDEELDNMRTYNVYDGSPFNLQGE